MSIGKKISRSAHIGDAGVAFIHQRVNAMGHVWHERHTDAGIDGSIELRDPATGEVSNCHLQVQSKARDSLFAGETDDRFHYVGVLVRNVSVRHEALFVRTEVRDRRRFAVVAVG